MVMEEVCNITSGTRVALFSDNSPTVYWTRKLAAKSVVSGQLIRALALRLKSSGASPLSTLHISGDANMMTDIPSRSFGIPAKWHCENDSQLLTLYNSRFPLPNQSSWTVFQLSRKISMRLLSVLQMKALDLEEWRRLPKRGKLLGDVGKPLSKLWESTHIYRIPPSSTESGASLDLQQSSDRVTLIAAETKSELQQLVALSRPLARRAKWPMESTQPSV